MKRLAISAASDSRAPVLPIVSALWVVLAIAATLGLPRATWAADLPSKVTPPSFEAPPAIPVFSWTGFYLGLHAGYGFGRDRLAVTVPGVGSGFLGYNPHGITGGLHGGYTYALASIGKGNALVIGAEADADAADAQASATPFGGLTLSTQSQVKGSIRGRLGVGINRALFYATGGAAFAEFDTRYNSVPLLSAGAVDTQDRGRAGYTVGGGIEYAFLNYLSVRAEYRYTDYGTFVDTLGAAAPGLGATVAHRETDNRIQAGISYKFDSILPAPVVARY